tara:strand:+ start:86222 stop:86854 length:633 start_codon:yes stop_codon:yes gene_type:complete
MRAKKKNRTKRAAGASAAPVHPLIGQAISNGARLDRGVYEVALVQNPYGEVVIRGEMRRHKAVRRVPHFETLYRSRVIDAHVFACLEWYADRLALAQSGLFRCGLDVSGGGGGSAASHIPTTQAAMEARSDVEWARGFVAVQLLPAFDAVMVDGISIREAARRGYAQRYVRLSVERARKRIAEDFIEAARAMAAGVAPRIIVTEEGRIRA